MNNSNFMNVLDTSYELVEYAYGLVLIDPFIFDDIIEEFSLFHVLHDQKQLLGSLNNFI
jgi:hypothetical protein